MVNIALDTTTSFNVNSLVKCDTAHVRPEKSFLASLRYQHRPLLFCSSCNIDDICHNLGLIFLNRRTYHRMFL